MKTFVAAAPILGFFLPPFECPRFSLLSDDMWSCIPYHSEMALSVREGFLFKDPFVNGGGFGAIRSEAKCCGIGSVYRVALDDGLGYVAVKTIRGNSRKLDQKLVDSFLAEVEILSGYKKNKTSVASSTVHHDIIDWPKRLHIAIGVAQGLGYLYNDCSPPIVHRDVKTSNILLDSQFNAKVGDFGLARILIKPEELPTMSVVAGTFGYIAPASRPSMKEVLKILIGCRDPQANTEKIVDIYDDAPFLSDNKPL
ncbi:hypothetical protein KIW84_064072 [Lathyrus oleraceus]|uniref:non-specific serine/threonine protein kinase n=1 Tax=Pisum sativum TaxID=3888 RepID=A0A9D4WBK1_PEA|nr:hypothetical protein KIW84_064072 [Pisum sativum]